MGFECEAGLSEDCLEGGMFDGYSIGDLEDVCWQCLQALEGRDRRTPAEDLPFGITD